MASNLVFYVKNSEQYEKFKDDLVRQFTINQISFTENFINDRLKIASPDSDVVINYYKTGKLVVQGSPDAEILKEIDSLARNHFQAKTNILKEEPISDLASIDKEYFIGLDEAGAGETFGSLFLGIAVITKENLLKAQDEIIPQDVKGFDIEGVRALAIKSKQYFARNTKRFVAREIDDSNKIALLDKGYIELLGVHSDILAKSCVVLDNYGIGPQLQKFLKEWESKGTKVILSHRADRTYLPPMAASIIARKARSTEIEKIGVYNSLIDPDTKEVIPFTTGSPSNPLTSKWLITYRKINPYADFPPFVRAKWKNVKEIEKGIPKKKVTYIFGCNKCKNKFGRLLIRFNRITTVTELLCPDCSSTVVKEYFKENFKTGTIVMDTSSLINRMVSKDLRSTKYFEGMKILIPSCIYEEIDRKQPDIKKGAENEIKALKEFQDQGIIDFQDVDTDSLNDLSNDKKIIHVVREHGASLITYDRTQNLWASIGSFVFVIVD